MIPRLETARLELQPLALEDAPQIQEFFPRQVSVDYLALRIPWPYPEDGALTFIRDHALPAMERCEQWHWTLRLKTAPKQIIGLISLQKSDENNRGFWIGQRWRGQGLMTEAAAAVTDYWFDVLGFAKMRIPKAAPNLASRRISERQGMRIVGIEERDYVGGRFLTGIWEVTAEEWSKRR
jgi:[ribosomal protein S5]-alanine N-acetyltransferase